MGSLVAVRLPPGPAFLEAWDRIWSAGDALLPLDHDAPDPAIARVIDQLRPDALVVSPPGKPETTRVIRLDGGNPIATGTALVVATSGSTGDPKGVVLSHAAVEAAVSAGVERLGVAPGSSWLSCLPWHHTAGLLTVLRSRTVGAEPIVHPTFDIEGIRGAMDRAAWVSLVPTQLHRLLDASVPLDHLSGVLLGGARAPRELLERAAGLGVNVVVSYGMTETCGGCVYDGRPLEDVEVAIDGKDRILIRGPVLCDGYRDGRTGRATLTEPATVLTADGSAELIDQPGAGWLPTEDLGTHVEGRLEVLGRRDDIIVTGGENVSADAVAARLREHADVRDAVVIGVPDDEWGQRVVAAIVVVPTRDATPPAEDRLRAHVRSALGDAAGPRSFVFVQSIPRTALGKPDRQGLLKLF